MFLDYIDNSLRNRDYIQTHDFSVEELEKLIHVSGKLKDDFRNQRPTLILDRKTIFLFFFDKSTRTRNSFEAGITQLGGHGHYVDSSTSQIAHGESAKDTGIILSSYGHGIGIRHDLVPGEGNKYMREVAKYANVPVINLQCDVDHPCQTLADLMTIKEVLGNNIKGRKIAVSWAYTPSYAKPMSVPQGLITLMTRFGMEVALAHPPEFKLMPDQIEIAKQNAQKHGGKFYITDSMEEAFKDADVVYPKSWGCHELFDNPDESLKLAEKYRGWICDEKLMKITKPESIYMHCLPADRGNEVTDEVMDGEHSVIYQQAENRLHTGKAIMAMTM